MKGAGLSYGARKKKEQAPVGGGEGKVYGKEGDGQFRVNSKGERKLIAGPKHAGYTLNFW